MYEPTLREGLRAMWPTWRLALILSVVTVAGLSCPVEGQEGDLSYLQTWQIEEVTFDATLPVHPGEDVVELAAADVNTCPIATCVAVSKCSGACHSDWMPLPSQPKGPGIWAWNGACFAGSTCLDDTTIIPNSGSEFKTFCGCFYDKKNCAPDYRYVGTRTDPQGNLFYKAVKLPAVKGEPKHCK